MRIAILTDLHANREAVSACLASAHEQGAEKFAFLGDLVGSGADPAWVVDTVREHVARGALAVLGNHDEATARETRKQMTPEVRETIDWTRAQLDAAQLEFLGGLPLSVEFNGCLLVHASAMQPQLWSYITDTRDADISLRATTCRVTFCGHTHDPALYNMSADGRVSMFTPKGECSIPLVTSRRWLAIPGAVGQPRDGNPAACYAMFDDVSRELTYFRIPYDHEAAAAKIIAAGLPQYFGTRLGKGE